MSSLALPAQRAPVVRGRAPRSGAITPAVRPGGVVPSAVTGCEGLTGLAQQMCFAVKYGI